MSKNENLNIQLNAKSVEFNVIKKKKFKKKYIYGYLFIAPPFIGFILFGLIPIVYSFYISMTSFDLF